MWDAIVGEPVRLVRRMHDPDRSEVVSADDGRPMHRSGRQGREGGGNGHPVHTPATAQATAQAEACEPTAAPAHRGAAPAHRGADHGPMPRAPCPGGHGR